ncbi:MAG: FliG C-terminal domain-containing protein [Spirochaetia bacterium]
MTIKEIAKRANVSISTVSRYLQVVEYLVLARGRLQAYDSAMSGENRSSRRAADAYGKAQKLARPAPVNRNTKDKDQPAFEKIGTVASGPERVAHLLIAMGPDRASEILGRLEPAEIEMVAKAVIQTPSVRREEAERLLQAIGRTAEGRSLADGAGGPEIAREMLVRAFGEDRGERFFRDAVPDAAPSHFQFLDDLEPHQLRLLFRDESAGAIAVVITHLDRASAGSLLSTLPADRQTEVVRRVAKMGRLNRGVIVRIEEAVREKIRQQGHQVTQSVDGNEKLAAILRHMAPSAESEILSALDLVDPELSQSVKERLYTTDLLLLVRDRDLADLLRDFGDSEVALFLKGKTEELRARVLRAISERRRVSITEEYAHLGAQKREDVDKVTHELLERLRELEEDGTILVPREGDRYI